MLNDYNVIFGEYIEILGIETTKDSPLYPTLLDESIEIGTLYKAALNMLISFGKKTGLNVNEYRNEMLYVTRELERLHLIRCRTSDRRDLIV